MIAIIGYLFGAWGLGWCFGFALLSWKRFMEVSTSG